MNEIDLIPADYRDRLLRRTAMVRFVVALLAVNAVVFVSGVALSYLAAQKQATIRNLQAANAVTQQQALQLQQLDDTLSENQRRWALLRSLRSGAAVEQVFSIVDQSIAPGDLWFLDWKFTRAGVVVDGEERGVETGYFVIVADGESPPADDDLSVETRMTIHGQAKDHQALSTFVRALFDQRDIKDVNLQRTTRTAYGNRNVVDFNLTVVLNSAYGAH